MTGVSVEKLVQCDGEAADAFAGGVIDGVCDRRRDADNADFANALDAERVDVRVRLVDEDHVDVANICVHRNVVLGDIRIHDPAEAVIHHRLLVQGHPDSPDHAAHDLAAASLGVQNPPGRDGTDDPRHANDV